MLSTLAATGCPSIGSDLYDEKAACLDEDGDGAPRDAACICLSAPDEAPGAIDCSLITNDTADCDDTYGGTSVGAQRTPHNTEIPYDGIDNDCDGLELFDVDGDHYPGILEADWVPLHGRLEWDPTLEAALDCDDTVATSNPGVVETPYDGVDANCDALDDYDVDQDGHALKAVLLPPGSVTYTGSLPQDDCDDADDDVFPGTSVTDAFYDGVDQDCDGSNDFDRDGDGYIRTSDAVALVAYEDKYALDFDNSKTGDCGGDPTNPTTGADTPAGRLSVAGDHIFPGASDAWYDDVDADCAGNDDYDKDDDGFVPDAADLPNGSPTYHGPLADGDCDDNDAEVGPGALELLGDSADQDCDGGNDTTAFTFGDWVWDTPSRPVVGKTTVPHYLLAVVAKEVDERTDPLVVNDPKDFPGIYFKFTPDKALPQTTPDEVFFENIPSPSATPFELGDAVQMLTAGNVFYLVTSHTRLNSNTSRLDHWMRVHKLNFNSPQIGYIDSQKFHPAGFDVPAGCTSDCRVPYYTDVDMIQDPVTHDFWAVGCEQYALHFVDLNSSFGAITQYAEAYGASGDHAGDQCLLMARASANPVIHTFGPDKQAFDPMSTPDIVPSTNTDWNDYVVHDVLHHDNLVILSGGSTGSGDGGHGVEVWEGSTQHRYLDSSVVLSADAVISGSTIGLVAVVQKSGTDEIHFLHGPVSNPVDTVFPHVHPATDTEPTGVAIYADTDRVFIAATAVGDDFDTVGWAFLGFAN